MMSGSQERTQPLDSQWSGPHQGPTARSHPDSCASLAELQAETAAARDITKCYKSEISVIVLG